MDRQLAEANRAADHTVFVSEWLRDYHAARWFDAAKPHSVIHNGADPSIFHPIGAATWRLGSPLRRYRPLVGQHEQGLRSLSGHRRGDCFRSPSGSGTLG